MPINQKLAYKGLKYLSILLILLILSPLLFTISIKALKIYDEGALFYISIASLIVCIIMAFCTLFFAFKTFKTLLDALFYEHNNHS